jgi:hypothetical protein
MFTILVASPQENETGRGLNEKLLSGIEVHLLSHKKLSRHFPDV